MTFYKSKLLVEKLELNNEFKGIAQYSLALSSALAGARCKSIKITGFNCASASVGNLSLGKPSLNITLSQNRCPKTVCRINQKLRKFSQQVFIFPKRNISASEFRGYDHPLYNLLYLTHIIIREMS